MDKKEFIASIPMPFTGESIVDGILVTWLVKPGDHVKKGQHIAEIETEKSSWDFEAPCEGDVAALNCEEGDVVDVGAPLLEIRTIDPDVHHLEKGAPAAKKEVGARETDATPAATAGNEGAAAGDLFRQLSPRLKKMVQDNNLNDSDLLKIKPTGPDGRITATDIGTYLDELEAESTAGAGGLLTCYIRGIGSYAPPKVVDNSVFLKTFDDINENYIEKVTGIRERHWAENESTSDLAFSASTDALQAAGMEPSDLDLIILATTTPDMPLPATACALQQKLGCTKIPAFDIAAACSGWLYALSIGRQYIQTGTYRNVLIVAAEIMSKFTDKTDRATAFLFGDGAGAAVLSSDRGTGDSEGHVLSEITMEADSTGYDIIYRKAGGSSYPPGSEVKNGDEYWFMDGGRMFRGAVTAFSDIIETVARTEGVSLQDFAWVVPHQANQRILKSVAHKLKIPMERVFFNIEKYGNTSGATIPLCLKDLENQGKLKRGDKLLLCAVGAGLTISGGCITW